MTTDRKISFFKFKIYPKIICWYHEPAMVPKIQESIEISMHREVKIRSIEMLSFGEYILDYGENRNSTNLYGNQTRWQF